MSSHSSSPSGPGDSLRKNNSTLKLGQFPIVCRKTNSLWLITKETDNPVNQAKLEANTCSWREARENVASERVMTGFGFRSDWLKKKKARNL